jgi:hypothetical protein
MIDVRLTATNPEDSTLVPVPCNARGELLTVAPKIESIPNDVEINGDLTVTGLINGSAGVGEPGPPGAPGVGELPPDPYEGALLGWEGGQLAWLGQAIVLPAGTYGPYTYQEIGTLEIPQDASTLVYGQSLFMSDEFGRQAYETYETDTIASVVVSPIAPDYALGVDTSKSSPPEPGYPYSNLFDGSLDTSYFVSSREPALGIWINFNPPLSNVEKFEVYGTNGGSSSSSCSFSFNNGAVEATVTTSGRKWYEVITASTPGSPLTISSVQIGGSNIFSGWGAIRINGTDILISGFDPGTTLSFPTDNNFDKFQVGDVVQTDVSITAINDSSPPTITVSGGTWEGADNSGVAGGDTLLATEKSGEGTVSSGMDGAIILRENNGLWSEDFYVTAPEQAIAARRVAATARKLRKK